MEVVAEKRDSSNPANDESHSIVDSNDFNNKEADEQRSRDIKAGLHPLKVSSCHYVSSSSHDSLFCSHRVEMIVD